MPQVDRCRLVAQSLVLKRGVLVVAHGTLWRQSFNYKTPFRAATIANSFNYLPADNNIAGSVAGDYPRTYHVDEFIWFLLSFFVHDFCAFVELLPSKFPSTRF
jgi:hypothetical protein